MKTTKQLFCQGADEALLYTTRTHFHAPGDIEPHQVRTSDEDLAREVMAIEKTMRKLTKTNVQLFRWPSKARQRPLLLRKSTSLADDFLSILRSGLGWIRHAFPHHQFHPLIELFERHMEARSFQSNFKPLCQDDVDRLNACVKAIRDEASSKAFRGRRDTYHQLVVSNTRGLLRLTDRLIANHSQLLVVRMDLSYRRLPNGPWLSLPITEEQALNHRDQMIRYLRRKCPFKPLGYAWKLEFTEHTGWHTHWLLFFDGNRHQQDLLIAEHIGQHWNREITQDDGRYFICNYEKYEHRGVGKIHHTDVAKIWALRTLVVPYLTKADYYVRMVLTKKKQAFGRSELLELPPTKRGRPRALASAKVADFVPPLQPSSAVRKKKASAKSQPLTTPETILPPLSQSLLADMGRAWFTAGPSSPGGLSADESLPAKKEWAV